MTKFKQARIGDKSKLLVELNMLTPELSKLTKRINILKEQIKDIEVKTKGKGLHISKHAINRFKERIGLLNENDTNIKEMIITESLVNKYKMFGDGRIEHPDIEDCIVAIQDNVIITIINDYNPYRELSLLKRYMNYFINSIANQDKPNTFEKFKVNNITNRKYE